MTDKLSIDLAGARWFTSSYTDRFKECVEVAFLDNETVAVRDSKNRTGPTLLFTPTEWDTFLTTTLQQPGSDLVHPGVGAENS